MTAAQDLECKFASAVAVRAEQQSGMKVSFSTTTRCRQTQHLKPRTVPSLPAKHKAARLAFANAASRSSFQRMLITDSKILRLTPADSPAGLGKWYHGALQLQEAQWAKQSTVHL